MLRNASLICFLAVLATAPQAAPIYKCEDAQGQIVYRDHQCDAARDSREIDSSTYTLSGRGGLTDDEWQAYQRLLAERAMRVQARTESGRAQLGKSVGYEDRLRLRELRMRRSAILDSLNGQRISVGRGVALRQELEEIGRQEEGILGRPR